MQARTTIAGGAARPASDWWRRTSVWVVTVFLMLVVAVAVFIGYFVDEPMRQRLEQTMNQKMTGYTVRLPELDFHPIGLSLTLRGLTVRQNAHRDPPVIVIDRLDAGVHWRALLHFRLVADFGFDGMRLHINRPQLLQEASDPVPVENKGWQDALEAIYPLKINRFHVTNGSLTYVDDDPKHPLELSKITFRATNIRNVSSPDRTYPSPVHVDATVFERGALRVDGEANFLAEPFAGVRAEIALEKVPLQRLKPVAAHANVQVTGGTLTELTGKVEYAPKVQDAHLRRLIIDGIAVDYTHGGPQSAPEVQAAKKATKEVTEEQALSLRLDQLTIRDATLGYVERAVNPGYRLFLDSTTIDVQNASNRDDTGPARIDVSGRFMGSGDTRLDATLLARPNDPQLDMAMQIEHVPMESMNDLFRSYGDFDVVAGSFAFYSELHIKNGDIDGYVKPLFSDMKVYDRRQDKNKPVLQQLYELFVGALGHLLENRREAVATEATIKGQANSPQTSTWEVVKNLLKNAFIRAILPGFERAVRDNGAAATESSGRSK